MIISSAGPSFVGPHKRAAMGWECTNTDLDPEYVQFHKATEKMISQVVNTQETSFVMLGEALLALEAACASLIEEGDRVLIIHNGFFGYCFKDFAQMYGAEAVLLEMDYRHGLDPHQLEELLKQDSNFKMATLVHCETPSGITNPIEKICPLLHKYGIISVVDSVSAIGGEYIEFDRWHIDVLIGGSQKCFSIPSGLATVTLSKKAKEVIDKRKTSIRAFYANFKNHYDHCDKDSFLYTMNDSLMHALRVSLEKILSQDFVAVHEKYGSAVRKAFLSCGYKLYPKDSFSNTVTAILLPDIVTDKMVLEKMREQGIIISGGLGHLEGKCIRIGHMGDNNTPEQMRQTLDALDGVFDQLHIKEKKNLAEEFSKILNG